MSKTVPGIIIPNTKYAMGPTGPTGPRGLPGVNAASVGNSVFVDAIYGDDSIAQVESYILPFKCLPAAACAAAQLAASRCETKVTVYVRPGIYHVDGNIARDKVNWYFEEGAIVKLCNGPLFDDCELCTGFDVLGYGEFISIDSTGIFKLGHVCEAEYNLEGKEAKVFYHEHHEVTLIQIDKQRATYNIRFDSLEICSDDSVCRTCGITSVAHFKSDNISMNVDTIKVRLPNVTNTAGSFNAIKIDLCGFERVRPIDIKSREISLEVGYYNSCECETEVKTIDIKVDGDPEGIISIQSDKLKAKTNDISTSVVSKFGVACVHDCGSSLNVDIQSGVVEVEGNNNPFNATSYAFYLSGPKVNLQALDFELEYYSNQGSLHIIDVVGGAQLTGEFGDIKLLIASNNYGELIGLNVDCESEADLEMHSLVSNIGVIGTDVAASNSGNVTSIYNAGDLKLNIDLLEFNMYGNTVNFADAQNTGFITLANLIGSSKIWALY